VNPDGTGEVLLYPYYTVNDGNQTLISVVNTTDAYKALKIRFLEGFNSREVLDFNIYMSPEDVWVAAIADSSAFGAPPGVPHIQIPDTTCTVPYLYENASTAPGLQAFLDIAYNDYTDLGGENLEDNGPRGIARAGEGHIEIIEMGEIDDVGVPDIRNDGALRPIQVAIKHVDGMPGDCGLLTALWTEAVDSGTGQIDFLKSGKWVQESIGAATDITPDAPLGLNQEVTSAMLPNGGGLFGGAAIVNAANGTMYSYDAKALMGFEGAVGDAGSKDVAPGVHYRPGTIYPSLNSGGEKDATVFLTGGSKPETLMYQENGVDAVSAAFMHDAVMNEYVVLDELNAGTEWVITFPTKNFYADLARMTEEGILTGGTPPSTARAPFTYLNGAANDSGPLCEVVSFQTWDREEATFIAPDVPGTTRPPTVSPSLPPQGSCVDFGTCPSYFQLCNEVNVLRFGEQVVFGTPTFVTPDSQLSLLITVEDEFEAGWGKIDLSTDSRNNDALRVDEQGLVGLPVAGFAAFEFENGYLDGGSVKANYGGLFGHKTSSMLSCQLDGSCTPTAPAP
jgi:hypothetical protein